MEEEEVHGGGGGVVALGTRWKRRRACALSWAPPGFESALGAARLADDGDEVGALRFPVEALWVLVLIREKA
jgi:hypothetical protein